MAMQSVNLYLPELHPKREWLTAQTLLVCTLVYIVLMIVTLQVYQTRVAEIELQAQTVENTKLASEQRLVKYRNMSKSMNVAQIDEEIAHLKHQVFVRQQLGQIIQGQNLGNEAGFSRNMEALARQSLNSIALAHIRLSRGGAFIELKGETRTPGDVPFYIEKLQQEESFYAVQFGALSVGQKNARQGHEFSLGFESVYQMAADNKGLR